jgi:UDP-N-acetylmuramate dehydrogenase
MDGGGGLKGTRVGGAGGSEKHAGFIINAGGATARDILELIALVQEKVLKDSGVKLETEVRVLGEDA